jgi:hypothetical protein
VGASQGGLFQPDQLEVAVAEEDEPVSGPGALMAATPSRSQAERLLEARRGSVGIGDGQHEVVDAEVHHREG